MFWLFRILIFFLILAAIAVGIYFWSTRVTTLERYFSKWLNTEVTIEEVHLSWGKLSIEGLTIATPPQSTLPYSFQGKVISIEMSPLQLLRQTAHIDNIQLKNPLIGIELYNSSGTDNNWSRLLNSLPSGGDRKFIVKRLTVINLNFDVIRFNGRELSIPTLPYLELENLGEMGALSLSQVSRLIFQVILQNVSSTVHLGAILENVPSLPEPVLEGVRSNLPLEEARGALQDSVEAIRRKSKEASKYLKDLFSSE